MIIPEIDITQPVELPETKTWPKSVHLFDRESELAVRTALASRRPLLIRGEPGTGKSQMARAVAKVWDRLFVSVVVNARTESQDLMWNFDAVARLGEAQAGHNPDRLEPKHYLSPGPLWWAFDYTSAAKQYKVCRYRQLEPDKPDQWTVDQGCVVLIDEIDKADAELPNGLLEILGNGAFSVPYTNEKIGLIGSQTPLVVVTTNEERELPAAFVRRCMVLQLKLPEDKADLVDWLVTRGGHHFPDDELSQSVLEKTAESLWEDRGNAIRLGMSPPGQAEYIDLLRALKELASDEAARLKLLDETRRYAFQKHAELE